MLVPSSGEVISLFCRHNIPAFALIFDLHPFLVEKRLLLIMPKFVPRQRKHKHRQREEARAPVVDTNFAEVPASVKIDKEARRRNLREALRSQHPKVSSKKQKRLDKYIVCATSPSWSICLTSAG